MTAEKSLDQESSCSEEFLEIRIDSEFTFPEHDFPLCSKANKKLSVSARVSKYLDIEKRWILMKSYISSQFNFCPLTWMCHSRKLNMEINKVHKQASRIVYCDYKSSFQEFPQKDNSVTIQKNLQYLEIEICKVKMGQSPLIMTEVVKIRKDDVLKVFILKTPTCILCTL